MYIMGIESTNIVIEWDLTNDNRGLMVPPSVFFLRS